ncbi:hypothetical protein [Myceligenerans crystallogenes]|uniref:PKD domain-containing protein n=1 Tax=Myceligenerans crystallogenes TaxID=316335 RepID=A0ABN2NAT2_9MICO
MGYTGIECPEGQESRGALFEQRRTSTGWTTPEMIADESCVDPPQERDRRLDLAAAAARAFHDMNIRPSAVRLQPPDGTTLVNLDTIAFTDDTPREADVTLFGVPVTIRAVPDSYTWDWGDGADPTTTTDPGAPYPDHTITHAYTTPGKATIRITTTWHGQFRLPGTPTWQDVPGTATTESTSTPITILEAHTRLVEEITS